MYSRLQSRLNPVPESLNSPDTMAPIALGRPPAKDDPIRVYNRDLAVSSSTVSTTSSSRSSNAVLASTSNLAKSQVNKKTEETNGYRWELLITWLMSRVWGAINSTRARDLTKKPSFLDEG